MKQKVLITYIESGFGHISSMDSISVAFEEKYGDSYDIEKSYILTDDGFTNLEHMNRFLIKETQYTNKIPYFGRIVFPVISLLGGHKVMRFVHRQVAHKSFRQGLEAIRRRKPDIIVTNHYFTDLLAVEYKRRFDPDVVVINYNPDPTLHTFWDRRDGVFVVNNPLAYKKAQKYKFKQENLRLVTPCVRSCVEQNELSREKLREKHGLPQDKFTVVVADGGYMLGRGPRFAKALIKSGLPITLCVIAGKNKKRYDEFCAIAEGKSKLKLSEGMTLKVYEFLENAYELYGAADVFLTKGGPNAVLDSIYMHTPVIINYCPHVMEAGTVKVFINKHGCGETAYSKRKTIKRIRALMKDKTPLDEYERNIESLIAEGNGATAVADIIEQEAAKQRFMYEAKGVLCENDCEPQSAEQDKATSDEAQEIIAEAQAESILADDTDATVGVAATSEQSETTR
ncbi:MAG: hypothetical protein J1G01_03050 [Clostridiales bacterium]|nr:hypothetical protein [Clostridiales bacterium]